MVMIFLVAKIDDRLLEKLLATIEFEKIAWTQSNYIIVEVVVELCLCPVGRLLGVKN